MKLTAIRLALVALLISSLTQHAFAVNKETIQIQEEVQQLQDSVSKLQQYNEERMGAITTLLQQTADAVSKLTATMDAVQKNMGQQQEAQGAKIDQISGQMQSLNDSVDELKARLDKLQKQLADVQSQTESMNAAIQHPDATGGASGAGSGMGQQPGGSQNVGVGSGKPSAAIPVDGAGNGTGTATDGSTGVPANTPPADQLYAVAYGDYMAAKYTLAGGEFGDVVHYYPDNTYAGSAHYYLGEIAYKQGHYAAAIKEYDIVIESFPGHNKVPGAELHKAFSLLASKQTAAGQRELRSLIQRYPNTPEATVAHNRLNAMR